MNEMRIGPVHQAREASVNRPVLVAGYACRRRWRRMNLFDDIRFKDIRFKDQAS
jgi:hypothetical protein